MADLSSLACQPVTGAPLDAATIAAHLRALAEWRIDAGELVRTFKFDDYHATIAFVNALAWISHRQDHHPELIVGYSTCTVRYSTHSVGGLSINDFICAARADRLFA